MLWYASSPAGSRTAPTRGCNAEEFRPRSGDPPDHASFGRFGATTVVFRTHHAQWRRASMVSFNALFAQAASLAEPEKPSRTRPRHDWVRGEVRCLMCARLLGRLLGTDRRRQRTQPSAS